MTTEASPLAIETLADAPAVAVTVLERGEHFIKRFSRKEFFRIKRLIPEQQISGGRIHRTGRERNRHIHIRGIIYFAALPGIT